MKYDALAHYHRYKQATELGTLYHMNTNIRSVVFTSHVEVIIGDNK